MPRENGVPTTFFACRHNGFTSKANHVNEGKGGKYTLHVLYSGRYKDELSSLLLSFLRKN